MLKRFECCQNLRRAQEHEKKSGSAQPRFLRQLKTLYLSIRRERQSRKARSSHPLLYPLRVGRALILSSLHRRRVLLLLHCSSSDEQRGNRPVRDQIRRRKSCDLGYLQFSIPLRAHPFGGRNCFNIVCLGVVQFRFWFANPVPVRNVIFGPHRQRDNYYNILGHCNMYM